MEATRPYEYLDLDPGEIRLLEIIPCGDRNDPLEIRLISIPLQSAPPFAALPEQLVTFGTVQIICNNAHLVIREKSYTRLLSLRKNPRGHTLFWVEEICIGYEDYSAAWSHEILRAATETLLFSTADLSEASRLFLIELATLGEMFCRAQVFDTESSQDHVIHPLGSSVLHGSPKITSTDLALYHERYELL